MKTRSMLCAAFLTLGFAPAHALKGEVSLASAVKKGVVTTSSIAKVRAPVGTVLFSLPIKRNAIQAPIRGVESKDGKSVRYELKAGRYGVNARGPEFSVLMRRILPKARP